MSPRYPVLVDLSGRPCLVVGGGPVAERKVRGLLDVDADVTVISPHATEGLARAAAEGRVRWHRRSIRPDDIDGPGSPGWGFVVAATDQPAVNGQVVKAASAVGTWANDVTSAHGGPAALPALHRQGDLTVAVSTGGVHPGAAGWIRDLVADAIGPEHLVALDLVAEVKASSPGGARPDWRTAAESGMLELIREGRVAEAKERLQACLSSSSD
ncbi:bifunctional precorrin-2 dehydrogenase/sirohydrochlorin ferrochelatase [soil metagenome]